MGWLRMCGITIGRAEENERLLGTLGELLREWRDRERPMSEAVGQFSRFMLSAVALMLVLHAFLVMCEISLVKFRYGGVNAQTLEQLKRRRGIARLIENGDRTGRAVRFSKTFARWRWACC